jgi:hypothetical protein
LDITVKKLTLNYEILAQRAVKLNESYLSLLEIYDEINMLPELLPDLEASGTSPRQVLAKMEHDRQTILEKFTELSELVTETSLHFTDVPESTELQAIAHDQQVMKNFVTSLDLQGLDQMFSKLSHS